MSRPDRNTMTEAFRDLTVDGVTLGQSMILDHIQAMEQDDELSDDWKSALIDTIEQLTIGSGGMPAMTSGTTGPPKRYNIPRQDLVNSAHLTGDTFGLGPGDRALHCLPCGFVAGKMMIVRAFTLGLDLHFIPPRGNVLQGLRIRDRFRFTAMVPMQLQRAIQEDGQRVGSQFETILVGGGPVSDILLAELQALSSAVFESYGSTETVTHVAIRPLNDAARQRFLTKHGDPQDAFATTSSLNNVIKEPFEAIGHVHFGRDPRGCLVVYTPHLSVRQHVTNDLIELIDDTHFKWLGRFDNVILSGGKKIFPEQLEARTAGVLGYPHFFTAVADDVLGQAVLLVLETDRPEEEVMPEIMEKIMGILHAHEWPRRVQTLSRIKRTNGGKVIRN